MYRSFISQLILFFVTSLLYWSVRAYEPKRRSYHASVFDGKKLYIFGGRLLQPSINNVTADNNELWALRIDGSFDPILAPWEQIPSVDAPYVAYQTANIGGSNYDQIVVYGGEAPDPLVANSLFYFDTKDTKWSNPSFKSTTPSRRQSHSAVTISTDHKIYIFGGRIFPSANSPPYDDFFSLDTISNSWTKLTTGPTGRYDHSATILSDGKMYVIGGFDGNSMIDMKEINIYDINKATWSKQIAQGDTILPRRLHRAVGTDKNFSVYYNEVVVLDTSTNPCTWKNQTTTGPSPSGRYGHSMTMSNGDKDSNLLILNSDDFTWRTQYTPNKLELTPDLSSKTSEPRGEPPSPTETNVYNDSNKTSTSLIIGVTFGGILILATVITIIFIAFKKHKKRRDIITSPYDNQIASTPPFTIPYSNNIAVESNNIPTTSMTHANLFPHDPPPLPAQFTSPIGRPNQNISSSQNSSQTEILDNAGIQRELHNSRPQYQNYTSFTPQEGLVQRDSFMTETPSSIYPYDSRFSQISQTNIPSMETDPVVGSFITHQHQSPTLPSHRTHSLLLADQFTQALPSSGAPGLQTPDRSSSSHSFGGSRSTTPGPNIQDFIQSQPTTFSHSPSTNTPMGPSHTYLLQQPFTSPSSQQENWQSNPTGIINPNFHPGLRSTSMGSDSSQGSRTSVPIIGYPGVHNVPSMLPSIPYGYIDPNNKGKYNLINSGGDINGYQHNSNIFGQEATGHREAGSTIVTYNHPSELEAQMDPETAMRDRQIHITTSPRGPLRLTNPDEFVDEENDTTP
ncbi:hypothetical protein G9A89_010725 [Geosiphon pyriformis]|nr:hypothetical protein G9A89_010725 [Geosiphon pyriformis]